MNVCSFCGKGEDQVRHLIRGGGRGDLPVVFICNECVGLCGLAAADGPDDPLDAARWQRITFEGEPYEWHATPVEGCAGSAAANAPNWGCSACQFSASRVMLARRVSLNR